MISRTSRTISICVTVDALSLKVASVTLLKALFILCPPCILIDGCIVSFQFDITEPLVCEYNDGSFAKNMIVSLEIKNDLINSQKIVKNVSWNV